MTDLGSVSDGQPWQYAMSWCRPGILHVNFLPSPLAPLIYATFRTFHPLWHPFFPPYVWCIYATFFTSCRVGVYLFDAATYGNSDNVNHVKCMESWKCAWKAWHKDFQLRYRYKTQPCKQKGCTLCPKYHHHRVPASSPFGEHDTRRPHPPFPPQHIAFWTLQMVCTESLISR